MVSCDPLFLQRIYWTSRHSFLLQTVIEYVEMSRMCGLELKAQLRRNQEWWKLSFTSDEHQRVQDYSKALNVFQGFVIVHGHWFVWLSTSMAASSVSERITVFLSNKDLTGWQVVALHWLNVRGYRCLDVLIRMNLQYRGSVASFPGSWALHCFAEEKRC